MGSSTVTGGVVSAINYGYATTNNGTLTPSNAATLAGDLQSMGATAPSFTSAGYTFTTTASTPMLRVYGGLSFEILVLKFDTQVMYVPATKNLGASFMTRLQL